MPVDDSNYSQMEREKAIDARRRHVQKEYMNKSLKFEDALGLLAGPLNLEDPESIFDDSFSLIVLPEDLPVASIEHLKKLKENLYGQNLTLESERILKTDPVNDPIISANQEFISLIDLELSKRKK